MRGVAVLGSTGSIGRSTLAVLRRHPARFRVVALTARADSAGLASQVAEWAPAIAGLADGATASGAELLTAAATDARVDIVVNAIVGAAGLDATLAALAAGKRVALANKESLVMAGELVLEAARAGGGEVVPIDSEHSAVLQCMGGCGAPVSRVTLTASGGPFRDWDTDRMASATVEEALRHPTWRMGRKISVDSATLANKALELIEAHHLFGLPYDALGAVIHPQSIVHALVEFGDGSVVAQLGFPSMELPILYALTHPDRLPDQGIRRFDPLAAGPLTFEPVEVERFAAYRAGLEAGRAGGTAPAVFNAANEEAVAAFLAGTIPFGRIGQLVSETVGAHDPRPASDLDTVRAADCWARRQVRERAA